MRNNRYTVIGIFTAIAILFPLLAHGNTATNAVLSLFGLDLATLLATIMNFLLSIAGFLLSIAGALLNVSLTITLHIRDFVDNTPAIYTIWKTIRDIAGLFFIFFLLFAAFQIILGRGTVGSYGSTIKNIIIAAILINFSFFFTGLAIDASNVVSLAIYRAMLPNSAAVESIDKNTNLTNLASKVTQNPQKGSLSDIFVQSLKIQTLYKKENGAGEVIKDPLRIMMVGTMGIIIMLTAAISFTLAAAAFIVRLVILLFLLAFSPIWFAATIIEELKPHTKKFTDQLKAQLLFMPVYLLLMYAALSVLSTSNIIGAGYTTSVAGGTGTTLNWAFGFIVLGVNAAMVIIMLNLPLVIGLGMGGMATQWIDTKKWGAQGIWGKIGGWGKSGAQAGAGFAGTRTLGKWGAQLDKKLGNSTIGNQLWMRDLRKSTTGALANKKFGAKRSYEETAKEQKDVGKKAKEIERATQLRSVLADIAAKRPPTVPPKEIFDKMGSKEKLAFIASNKEFYKNKDLIKHLEKSDYKSVMDAEDVSDENKEALKKARMEALQESITASKSGTDKKSVEFMVDNMSNEDLLKLAKGDSNVITDPEVVKHLTSAQLKYLNENGLDDSKKNTIGQLIVKQLEETGKKHPAHSFVENGETDWLGKTGGSSGGGGGGGSSSVIISGGSSSPNPKKFTKTYS